MTPIYKKSWKEDLGNYRSDLGAKEAQRADYLECHHSALTGQPSDQAQSAWVYLRQVLLDEPDLLLQQDDMLSEQGKGCGRDIP